MSLIVVESPTKARTFNRILKGEDYYVFATLGHIRDLPTKKISIDLEHDFKPSYEIIAKKRRVVEQLKKLSEKNNEIILATDPDREGESISYHVAQILGFFKEKWPEIKPVPKDLRLRRIIFHEITPKALHEALKKSESIRLDLVKAQQARRILDRIVGYQLSPLLWTKLGKNWLSAGRVQTVALRFIVEREKEIAAFSEEKYFQLYGQFKNSEELRAKLIQKNGEAYEKIYILKLFATEYRYTKTSINEKNLSTLCKDIEGDSHKVSDIRETEVVRHPPPPFTTSLLQQEAINRFGFSAKMVMRLAQNLYERGLITYHRTDSFNLSTSFVFKAKDFIANLYGPQYALKKPRGYKTRSKSAQEAHEAIRPTKLERTPRMLEKENSLTASHKKIYELIYNRAVATQMADAKIKQIEIFIQGEKGYLFESEHSKIIFDGFLKVLNPAYVKKAQTEPIMKKDDKVILSDLQSEEKFTLPPPRYSEASLIRVLEEYGIGRPSTYSPILSLIQDKGYVEKDGRYLIPTNLGTAISDYLSHAFPEVFDLHFTASMEDGLDDIADQKLQTTELLRKFYDPFSKLIQKEKEKKERIKIKEEVVGVCPQCGSPLTIKRSRFGRFYACTKYPECKFTKSILKLVKGKKCPQCAGNIVVRYSKKKKRFYGCENYPKCTFATFSYASL